MLRLYHIAKPCANLDHIAEWDQGKPIPGFPRAVLLHRAFIGADTRTPGTGIDDRDRWRQDRAWHAAGNINKAADTLAQRVVCVDAELQTPDTHPEYGPLYQLGLDLVAETGCELWCKNGSFGGNARAYGEFYLDDRQRGHIEASLNQLHDHWTRKHGGPPAGVCIRERPIGDDQHSGGATRPWTTDEIAQHLRVFKWWHEVDGLDAVFVWTPPEQRFNAAVFKDAARRVVRASMVDDREVA